MTLLERIIESAERDGSVSSLLRMMKTLAARTGADQLGKWANNELTGYGVDDTVPQYRGPFEIQVTATFRNSFGHFQNNVPIGSRRFPEDMRCHLFSYTFREPIAEIEAAFSANPETNYAWATDVVSFVNNAFRIGEVQPVMTDGWSMVAAAGHVPRSRLFGILDQVRTEAHSLALNLEQTVPSAGEPHVSSEMNEKAAVIINNNFDFSNADLSGSNNAFNSSEFNQSIEMQEKGSVEALRRILAEAGLAESDVKELIEAVNNDPDEPTGELGRNVTRWLQQQASKVVPAVATMITQSVFAFYGLPVGE